MLLLTSALLQEAIEVLGTPSVRLRLRVTGESADAFVRLCDVDPSGVSATSVTASFGWTGAPTCSARTAAA